MRPQTSAAILDTVFEVLEVTAALAAQRIEWAVAEQAVEILGVVGLVAGEKLACFMLSKGVAALLRFLFKYTLVCHDICLPVVSLKMIAEFPPLVKWAKSPLALLLRVDKEVIPKSLP